MSDAKITNTQMYQFLAQFNNGNSSWVDAADNGEFGKQDGIVLSKEFQGFVKENWNNWNGLETPSDDIIKKFFNTLDTNKSKKTIAGDNAYGYNNYNALSAVEQEDMTYKLTAYAALADYVKANVETPEFLSSTASQWLADINNKLGEITAAWIKNNPESTDMASLEAELSAKLQSVLSEVTAEYAAVEYQNELSSEYLKDYPDYKVADDKALQGIIANYVENCGEAGYDQINMDIREIIDAYFATAGLPDDSGLDLDAEGIALLGEYGYNCSEDAKLNDIQKEVLRGKLEATLNGMEGYEGHEDILKEAISKFVDGTLGNVKMGEFNTFADDIVTKFKESKEGIALEVRINTEAVFKAFESGDVASELYQAIVAAFDDEAAGKAVADYLVADGSWGDAYKNIKSDVLAAAMNGKIAADEVVGEIAKAIKENMNKILKEGYGNLELDALKTLYEASIQEAEENRDLAAYKEATINYLNALASKGEGYKNAIKQVFGDNYKNAINSKDMQVSEIKEGIAQIEKLSVSVVDKKDVNLGEWSHSGDTKIYVGNTGKIQVKVAASLAEGAQGDLSKALNYELSTNALGATIDPSTGEITVPGTTPGKHTLTVFANVNGEKIVPGYDITVEVKEAETNVANSSVTGWSGWHVGSNSDWHKNLTDAKASGIGHVNTLLASIKDTLIAEGYDSTRVEKAYTTAVNYYKAFINAITDQHSGLCKAGEAHSAGFEYMDADGNVQNGSNDYVQVTRDNKKKMNDGKNNKGVQASPSGIRLNENWCSNHSYEIAIEKAGVVNTFLNILKSIA